MHGSIKQEDAIRFRIILTSFIDLVKWMIKYELRSRRNLPTRDPASPDLQRHVQFVCIMGRRGFMNVRTFSTLVSLSTEPTLFPYTLLTPTLPGQTIGQILFIIVVHLAPSDYFYSLFSQFS